MNSSPILMFLQCIVLPFILPAFIIGFWLGSRFSTYGFPGMFIPNRFHR